MANKEQLKRNSLLDIEYATRYYQNILNSNAPEQEKERCRKEIRRLETMKRQIESEK